ncbi:MAG: helix-turn-helix domain-containing protein [Ktedonobacteraceae bacterium]
MQLTIDTASLGFASDWFRPGLMQRPHRHNEVEINLLECGALTYLFGGTRARVTAGQFALFWATIPHQVVQVEDASILHWLTIPFATFLRWQLPDMLTQRVVRGHFVPGGAQNQDLSYQQQFRQWYNDLQQGTPELRKIVALEVEACLRRVALSLPASATIITPASELSRVEWMASFIAEHYSEPLSIARVAHEVHLHPNYAMSLFRRTFAISIVDYITQYRIAHAQRLLITTDLNISQVAIEAGFGSVSRFYTAFKSACAQSPGDYRASLSLL